MNLGTQTFILQQVVTRTTLAGASSHNPQRQEPAVSPDSPLAFGYASRLPRAAVVGPACREGKAGGRGRHVLSSSRGGARSLGAGPNSHSCSIICSQLCDAGRPAKYELQINHVDSGVDTACASYICKQVLVYLNFTFNWCPVLHSAALDPGRPQLP